MARPWDPREFNAIYERFVCRDDNDFGGRAYHQRYRSRYKECIRRFAEFAPPHPVRVLDVGGGQLALMCMKLWSDHGAVADLPLPHLLFMAKQGVEVYHWNLCKDDPPFERKFDFIFFSEVIEHLPVPGYVALRRLREALKPGGVILCTTPNLYRPRNVVFMALGQPIFDVFQYPDADIPLGHVLEYSREHLEWQIKRAGFTEYRVEYCQLHFSPTNLLYRPLAWLGYPLRLVPRWRDSLVATALGPT